LDLVRLSFASILLAGTPLQAQTANLIAEISHPLLEEVSGIARSSHAGVFWVHNDSGNAPHLFPINLEGRAVIPPFVADDYTEDVWPGLPVVNAWNVDWEDIALADGHIYIADMGNNGNARRDLGVYVIAEPNPLGVELTRALRFIPVVYPDQRGHPGEHWHFDCEAMFAADGKLYFLTKHRQRGQISGFEAGTKLYRLDTQRQGVNNPLTLIGSRQDIWIPTAADISPDGNRLAVLTYRALWIFERPTQGDNWLTGKPAKLNLDRAQMGINEAVTWRDERTLVIANEGRKVFLVDARRVPPLL
jgi:hypothetical protein